MARSQEAVEAPDLRFPGDDHEACDRPLRTGPL